MSNAQFIADIAKSVQKYAPQYGIKVCSSIIAQAILESGWGQSTLASKYHNYFGLKCGDWSGKSVNMQTMEEYTVGTMTQISDNFRVFDSMDEGIKGYFEFIQYPRYSNLKGITDPQKYLEAIKADGYATSSTYVSANMSLVRQYNLTQYDGAVTSQNVPNSASSKKSIEVLAQEVIDGIWGNGEARKTSLTNAGYDYNAVQSKVDSILLSPKKSVLELAYEVIRGEWGNGEDRKNRLESAGYNYNAVQMKVNELL